MIMSPKVSSRKKCCIVHIGMTKTGSSAIQHMLYHHLDDPSFKYINLGGSNQGRIIYSLFSDSPEHFSPHNNFLSGKISRDDFIERKFKLLIDGLSSSNSSTIIFSGEAILRLNAESELPRFKNFLSKCFETIQIIGYVRAPHSHMESGFQQKLKRTPLNKLVIGNLYPNYRKKLQKFDHIFGRNNVQLVKFDTNHFPKGDIVLDFCQRLNINISPMDTQYFNESISKDAAGILFSYRKYGPGYGDAPGNGHENFLLSEEFRKISGSKLRFSPQLVQPVLEANREDIAWIENRIGETLAEKSQASDDDISTEDDLLDFCMSKVDELKQLIGKTSLPPGISGETAEEVAQLVHALRLKLRVEEADRRKNNAQKRNIVSDSTLQTKRINTARPTNIGVIQLKLNELIDHMQKIIRSISCKKR